MQVEVCFPLDAQLPHPSIAVRSPLFELAPSSSSCDGKDPWTSQEMISLVPPLRDKSRLKPSWQTSPWPSRTRRPPSWRLNPSTRPTQRPTTSCCLRARTCASRHHCERHQHWPRSSSLPLPRNLPSAGTAAADQAATTKRTSSPAPNRPACNPPCQLQPSPTKRSVPSLAVQK